MKIGELINLIDATICNPTELDESRDIKFGFSADLMSDALMLIRSLDHETCGNGVLLTGLATTQSIRTAEMLDIDTVLIVREKKPNHNVIKAATEAGILLLTTASGMYTTSGKLYEKGVKGYDAIKQ